MTLHWWMHWFWITWDIPVFLPLLLVVPVQSLPAKYESSPVYPLFSEEDLLPKDTSEVALGSIHDQAEKLWDVPHSQPFISNTSEHPNSTDSAPKDLDNITTEISLIEGVESSPTSYSSDELAVFGSDTVSESSAISDRQNSDLMFKDVVVTSDSDVLIAGDGDFVSSSTSHGDNRSVESVSDEWLENSSEMTVNVSSDNFGSAVQNPTDNTSNPSLLPTSSEQSHFDASTKFPSTRSGKSIGFVTPSSYDPPNVHERNVSVSNISSHVDVSTKLPDVNEDRKYSVPSAVERSVLEPEKQSKSVVSPRFSETSGDQVTTTLPYHHIPQFEPEENRSEENSKPSRPGISSKSYQSFQHDIALSDQAPEDSATKNKTQGLVNNEEIQKNASSKVVHNRVIFSHTISAGERNGNSSKTGSSVENGTSADSEEADNDSSQATNSRKEQMEETSNSTDKADVNAENEDESELPTLLPNNHPSLFNVVSPYDVEGSINTNEGLIPTVTTVMKGRISVYEGLNTASIIGITLGIVAFAGLIGIVSFFLYRRRYINKPQTLSDKCSNPDSSGYIDDTLRENSEEMYSLDNDSFLNSLEAMTIQNYWTDSVKHTKL